MKSGYSTAIHEAAHAVIGRRMGQVCGAVTIYRNEEEMEAGHSVCADPWTTVAEWDRAGRWREYSTVVKGRIIAFQAGRLAEELIVGGCAGGDEDDREQAFMMAVDIAGDAAEQMIQRLYRFSKTAVERHRDDIESVATALMERGKLDEDEILKSARGIIAERTLKSPA